MQVLNTRPGSDILQYTSLLEQYKLFVQHWIYILVWEQYIVHNIRHIIVWNNNATV